MNKTKYMQTDSRWGGLGYPRKPWYLRNCGCGEVSICNAIIEMEQYKDYTPATIQPYCKQYADPNGNGTYWSGILAMMKHYGLTEVKEHATMDKLWTELKKGGRVAIYLMGSRKGGSKGVHWTSSGHFVCSVDYKYENGDHWVYMKDSYSNSSLRNGWISYKGNIRGDCLKVWSGKLNGKAATTPTTTPTTKDGKLVVDGIGGLATVNRLQEFLGTRKTDGITVRKDLKKYVPTLTAFDYGNGSPTVVLMQKWLGLSNPDGLWGPNTSKALQMKIGFSKSETTAVFGANSMKALQKYLNSHDKAVYPPEPTPTPSSGSYIGQAASDVDHKAGDSTGKEVLKSKFHYSSSSTSPFNWTYVFRPKDSAKAEKAASMCEKAIANNAIGYNSHGETAYGKDKAMTKLAKAVNYDLSKITTKCGLSCGDLICLCNHWAGLSTCYIGSGLQLANNYKKNSNFTCLNYKKGMTLKRGDVLITAHSNGKNNHVAMVL